MLQREMMSTPLLHCYSVIVLDDVHERTVATEALLGLLQAVLAARAELRLVLLSAPHMGGALRRFCGAGPVLRVRGLHRARAVFSPFTHSEPFQSALRLLLEIHHSRENGDIVIFLACEQVSWQRALFLIFVRKCVGLPEAADVPPGFVISVLLQRCHGIRNTVVYTQKISIQHINIV